jgi:hypothetical protein
MSSALLVLWFARRWRAGAVLGFLYAGIMAIATMGGGEHYLFDLFGAIPYSLLIIYLSAPATQTGITSRAATTELFTLQLEYASSAPENVGSTPSRVS